MSDWYKRVPKRYENNLRFRRNLLKKAAGNPELRRKLKEACAEDILFYINTFCWTFNPRQDASVIPFITYEFQDGVILELVNAIKENIDVGIDKSRDMGASWMAILVFEWYWHFSKHFLSFLMLSRMAGLVDEKGNPKTLFHKIDFLHQRQPKWLLPKGRELGWNDPCRRLMHLENAETGTVIDGESTTGDAGRGDRRRAVLIDEFAAYEVSESFAVLAATRDTTGCRIFNSTPHGIGNAFYKVTHDMDGVNVISMHWTLHPVKNRGLYRTGKDGKVELLDDFRGTVPFHEKGEKKRRMLKFPENYPFILDKKVRSPWYDEEFKRCASAQEVAQELDIDYMGSDCQFFDQQTIEAMILSQCRPPEEVGDFEYDPDRCEPKRFVANPKGKLKLWESLPDGARIANRDRRFVLGADISAGTGASNSTAVVYDRASGEKIAEYANSNILPMDFARFCMALGRAFNKARIIPDRSGPTGEVFTKALITECYGNVYYRRNEKKVGRDISNEPGVWLNPVQKTSLMIEYRDALGTFKILNRSKEAMKECLQFIRKMDGTIEHSGSINAQDPGGARSAHGDIVVADALAWLDMSDSQTQPDETKAEIPENCLASRMKMREDEERRNKQELGKGW